jgi:hypothetical protein
MVKRLAGERQEPVRSADLGDAQLRSAALEFGGMAVILDDRAFKVAAIDGDGEGIQNLPASELPAEGVLRPCRRGFSHTQATLTAPTGKNAAC